jgi:uncharacterized protein YraI
MKLVARIASLAILCAAGTVATASFAADGATITTPAWTNRDLGLYTGPGFGYGSRPLQGGTQIAVERCSGLWCKITVGRQEGFVWRYALSFGHGPNSILAPQEVRHPGIHTQPGFDQ